jgi:hypothetical protein
MSTIEPSVSISALGFAAGMAFTRTAGASADAGGKSD